jgi:hypothetical protein
MSIRALRAALDRAATAASDVVEPRARFRSRSGDESAVRIQSLGGEPFIFRNSERLDLGAKPMDDGEVVGAWVTRRLAELAERRAAGTIAHDASRADANVTRWTTHEVEAWLVETALFTAEQAAAVREQGVSGSELLTLDDTDLRVLGVATLSERKRVLRLLAQLRLRSAKDVSVMESPRKKGSQPSSPRAPPKQQLSVREHLGALGECIGKVLAHTPMIPLKSRRLLLVLWHQGESVALEAAARLERERLASRRREDAAEARRLREARALIEAGLVRCAEAEDRAAHLVELLQLERQKGELLRESLEPRSFEQLDEVEEEARNERIAAVKKLVASDFDAAEVPRDLGETLLRVSDALVAVAQCAEGEMRDALDLKQTDE